LAVLAAISVLMELANLSAVTASSAILAVEIEPSATEAPDSKLVAVTFLEVPPSLINNSSLPPNEVFAGKADTLVVAMFTP